MSIRPIKRIVRAKPTLEGAGVHLRRAFGFGNTSDFDPFLLLDDFRNDIPEDYLAGFPWHPHRGIETITYVLAGTVEHGDSLGNRGAIAAGDVQWMTAGRGIIHQEMPKGDPAGRMHGFQSVGEPAGGAQDDDASLSGGEGGRHPGDRGRRRHPGPGHLRPRLGDDRSRGGCRRRSDLPRCVGAARQAEEPSRSRRPVTPSRTCSRGRASSATRRAPSRCRPKGSAGRTRRLPQDADNRSLVLFDRGDEVSVQAGDDGTPVPPGFGEADSGSRSRGTARS